MMPLTDILFAVQVFFSVSSGLIILALIIGIVFHWDSWLEQHLQ